MIRDPMDKALLKKGIKFSTYFIPGLGTYKAARAGQWLIFSANLVGDVSLAYWIYTQLRPSQEGGERAEAREGAVPEIIDQATARIWAMITHGSEGMVKDERGVIEVV